MNAASRVTDRVLAARSARMADVLARRGITAGDCVALAMPGVSERAVVVYGLLRLGAVGAPLEGDDEATLRHDLTQLDARLLVAWHTAAEPAEAAAGSAGVDVLFVAPGEFDRLLDSAEPRPTVRDRDDDDAALRVVGPHGISTVTHADLEPEAVLA